MPIEEQIALALEIAERWKLPQIWWALVPYEHSVKEQHVLRGFSVDGRVWHISFRLDDEGKREWYVRDHGRWEADLTHPLWQQ